MYVRAYEEGQMTSKLITLNYIMYHQSQVRDKMQRVDAEGAEQRWLAITPQCTDNIQGCLSLCGPVFDPRPVSYLEHCHIKGVVR